MSIANLTANVRNALEALVTADVPIADRQEALRRIELDVEARRFSLQRQKWTAEAQENKDERLTIGDKDYMVHMRHCYPKGGVDGYPAGCKYNEDHICPAALFDDPWAEYLRIEDEEDTKKNG